MADPPAPGSAAPTRGRLLLAAAGLVTTSALWGPAVPFTAVLLRHFDPFVLAVMRLALATAFLFAIVALRDRGPVWISSIRSALRWRLPRLNISRALRGSSSIARRRLRSAASKRSSRASRLASALCGALSVPASPAARCSSASASSVSSSWSSSWPRFIRVSGALGSIASACRNAAFASARRSRPR